LEFFSPWKTVRKDNEKWMGGLKLAWEQLARPAQAIANDRQIMRLNAFFQD
jgi:hypothetical protein